MNTFLFLITALSLVAGGGIAVADDADRDVAERVRRVLAAHPVVDGHNDLPWAIRTKTSGLGDVDAWDLHGRTPGDTDLERLRAGGVGGQFWSVYVPGEIGVGFARIQLEQIDLARRIVARYSDRLSFATTAAEVEAAMAEGRVASMLGIEGGHAIENSLGALRAYYDLGVRYMTLTHNTTLDWADSASDEPRHGGLTRFGEEVVREMNRLGMLVDLSHTSPDTMEDAIRVSEAPVIFSHSSARALCDHRRNVPDSILRKLRSNGGIVMVTFVTSFVSQAVADASAPLWAEYQRRTQGVADLQERVRIEQDVMARMPRIRVTVAEVADHVEHVRDVAGIDHVGLGGDFDGNEDWPEGLDDVSGYPRLLEELARRAWTDEELGKLTSGNVLRVMKEAEAVARRLAGTRPASFATIEELDGSARP